MPVWLGVIEMAKIVSEKYIRLDLYDVINNKNDIHKAILMVDKIGNSPIISAVFDDDEKAVMLVLTKDQVQQLINALNGVLLGGGTIQ